MVASSTSATSAVAGARFATNGGFPLPTKGEPVRILRATHEACGATTRLRLPRSLPAAAIRRIVCESCREGYGSELTEPRAGALIARFAAPAFAAERPGALWPIASVPIAALLVTAALVVIPGAGELPRGIASPSLGSVVNGQFRTVAKSDFTLVIPPNWGKTNPPEGAAFAAASADEDADAVLWIERDPDLSFAEFERRSRARITEITGNVREVERIDAPTDSGTSVRLRGVNEEGTSYDVTLRMVGDLHYYLITTLALDADTLAVQGVDLIHTFTPRADS